MMTCKEIIDFLNGYVDGEIAPAERAAFEQHLAVCPSCRAYLESYKRTIAMARGAFGVAGVGAADDGGGGCQTATEETIKVPESLVRAVLASRKQVEGGGGEACGAGGG